MIASDLLLESLILCLPKIEAAWRIFELPERHDNNSFAAAYPKKNEN